MDRLDAMATFVAVAELAGFAAAGRKLKRSAPMVTRAVASLEAHLGARLLNRTTRSVSLTDAGRHFLASAKGILAEVDRAECAAKEIRTTPSGRLVVSAPALFGRLHVGPLFSRFLLKHPPVRGELQLTDRPVSLVEEGVDVAVRIGVLADSSLMARKVGETARVVVASPRCKDKGRWIQFTGVNPPRDAVLVTNSADVALMHAIAGGGAAEVLAYQAADAIAAGRLEVVSRKDRIPIHCVYASAQFLSAAARAFIALAAEQQWRF